MTIAIARILALLAPLAGQARTSVALGVTVGFALLAWGLKGVTAAGALAGAIVTFVVFLAAGVPGFLAILTVFVLTLAATQIGYASKLQLGTAEPRSGRGARQIFANLLVTAIVASPTLFFPESRYILLIGACAALAEAAADTVSSEVGQAFTKNAYLVSDLRPVAAGVNGGISIVGTVAGLCASMIVAFACYWLRLVPPVGSLIVFIAGVLGMFLDSLLGATLETPGRLDNDSVNYVSNSFSASISLIAAMLFA